MYIVYGLHTPTQSHRPLGITDTLKQAREMRRLHIDAYAVFFGYINIGFAKHATMLELQSFTIAMLDCVDIEQMKRADKAA